MQRIEPTLEPILDPAPTAAATADPYMPPAAPLEDAREGVDADRFYVVSMTKYWVLAIATLGLYEIYWMYKHWANIKRATGGDEWPVMRGIFSIFFVHSLTAEIDQRLRRAAIRHVWNPSGLATMTVIAMLATRVLDRLAGNSIGSPVTDIVGTVTMIVTFVLASNIQRAANAACGDPDGRGNARFTVANYVWIGIGALLWTLFAVGLFMPVE